MSERCVNGRPARRTRRPVLLLLVLALLLAVAAGVAGLAASPAAAKSYTITSVNIDAKVLKNGDLRVTDTRTLDFSGNFHYVYWNLSTKGSQGIDVTGAEGPDSNDPSKTIPYSLSQIPITGSPTGEIGTYAAVDQYGEVDVQLNFDLADTQAAFTVHYVAKGAAQRYKDTAELYWQFVGSDTAVESKNVHIVVHLPQGVTKDQVRAWAHGPLWGNVTIQPDASVVLDVSPLPAETFVEGRILFPAEALSAASPVDTPRLQSVLAEEKALADQANRDRLMTRLKLVFWGLIGLGSIVLALVLILILYFAYGREPKTQFQMQYLRDMPQPALPPAIAGYIWNMGEVSRQDASATLLDLINRKVIDIAQEQVEVKHFFGDDTELGYRLTLHRDRLEPLTDQERRLVKLLFDEIAEEDSFIVSELKDKAAKHRSQVAKGWAAWKAMAEKDGESRGFLDSKADRMAFTGSAFAFVAIVGSGAAGMFSGWWWFWLGIPIGIGLVYAARSIKRRSQEAAELHAQYAALERYLKDFGRMQEKPPTSIVLWEGFLVFAVTFGIADQVRKAMTDKLPELLEDPGFQTPYFLFWGMQGTGGMSAFDSLNQSFSQAVSVATSSSSSGSGGGGGFSGGGGGGGGGGGFGAG